MGLCAPCTRFLPRRYKLLLYRVGTTSEVTSLPSHFPEKLVTELFQGLVVLDCEYGYDRNYMESGGYSIILETEADIQKLITNLDIHHRAPEWATWIDNTEFISCLYILSNDFSIMVYMPSAIMPNIIRKELEE